MMNVIRFLFSKVFWVNVAIALLITSVGLWYVFEYMEDYTLHGETITVPDFSGLKINELNQFVEGKEIQFVIADSIYDLSKPKGVVIDQNPEPDFQVKQGRKIYLTVNAINTPKIKLPEVRDLSIRQAIAKLESYDLKVGELIPRPGSCVNCALGMEHKGEEIIAGVMIEKNTVIDLIVGEGESGELIPVPYLVNLSLEEAKTWLKSLSINTSAVIIEDCETEKDSLNAKIYKQSPESNDENVINLGGSIDLWLTGDSLKLIEFLPDSLFSKDSLVVD